MGKFSELDTAIKDLRTAAESINAVADLLTEMFSEPKPTLEAVRAVLADKSRAGHTAEIRALLEKYGELEKLRKTIHDKIKNILGIEIKVSLVEPKTIERFTGKAQRVLDLRKK